MLVVARLRRVVVEGVLGAFVDVNRELLAGRRQSVFVGVDTRIDALILAGIVEQQGRLDFGGVFRPALPPVICDAGAKIRRCRRQIVDRAPAPAKSDRAHLAVGLLVSLQERDRGRPVGDPLPWVERADHFARLLLVRRRASHR